MNYKEPKEQSREIAIFDVCDTLYYSNTTHDFIRFVSSSSRTAWAKYSVMNSKFLPFRYLFIFISVFLGKDPLRALNISLLKGYSRDVLADLGRDFVENWLRGRKIEPIHAILRKSQEEGRRIILCSTSIDPVVAAVALDLGGVEFVSSTLEYVDGICTGRIGDDVGRSKLKRLMDLGVESPIDLVYSDNRGDLELLNAARLPVAVVHSERKKGFWTKHKIETLRP